MRYIKKSVMCLFYFDLLWLTFMHTQCGQVFNQFATLRSLLRLVYLDSRLFHSVSCE